MIKTSKVLRQHLLHDGVLSNWASKADDLHVISGSISCTMNGPASQVSVQTTPSPGTATDRPEGVLQENVPYSTLGRVHTGSKESGWFSDKNGVSDIICFFKAIIMTMIKILIKQLHRMSYTYFLY